MTRIFWTAPIGYGPRSLGLTEEHAAKPIVAALTAGAMYSAAAAITLATAMLATTASIILAVVAVTLGPLALLGAVGARVGGARPGAAALRVVFWGGLAMAVTAGVGMIFDVAV